MFRFMCSAVSFTFLLFSAADGLEKLQIACLQIQDGHCNSSIYWQSRCSKAANNSDITLNESNDVNTLDSKTEVPKHTNSMNKGTGHVIDSYSRNKGKSRVIDSYSRNKGTGHVIDSSSRNKGTGHVIDSSSRNKGTGHVIDPVSRKKGTYKSRIKFQVPQKIKSKPNPKQRKNNRGNFNAAKLNNNRGHQHPRRKGAPASMVWSSFKGINGGFQTQNKKGSQFERPQRYTFNATQVTWERARKLCTLGGGWLAKLDERYKWKYLRLHKHFLRPAGFMGYIWMGLRYKPQRRKFFWVDGSVFTNSLGRWSAGEPSHTFIGSPENCVAFTKGLRMNDRGCRKMSSFLCEYEPPKA